jgi:hypothetical protein
MLVPWLGKYPEHLKRSGCTTAAPAARHADREQCQQAQARNDLDIEKLHPSFCSFNLQAWNFFRQTF